MAVSVKKCIIPSCPNSSDQNESKLFIMVPQKENVRRKWFGTIGKPYAKSKHIYCCEDHFDLENDMMNWLQFKTIGTRVYMKEDVVPHKFIDAPKPPDMISESQLSPNSRENKLKLLEKFNDRVKRKFDNSKDFSVLEKQMRMNEANNSPNEILTVLLLTESLEESFAEEPESTLETKCFYHRFESTPSVKTKNNGIVEPFKPEYLNIMKSSISGIKETSEQLPVESESLLSSSGPYSSNDGPKEVKVESSSLQNEFVERSLNLIIKKSRYYLGLPENTSFIIDLIMRKQNIPLTDTLVCLKKIKLNDSDIRLATDFGITETYVSKIIQQTVPALASLFRNFVFWPQAEKVQSSLPILFRKDYKNVQSIVDFFEIQTEVPIIDCREHRQYKVKYLLSATPDGFINFVSIGFGEHDSHELIIESSGFSEVLPERTHMITNKYLQQTPNSFFKKQCELIILPTSASSERESADERKLAALRGHVEKIINRPREFKILEMHSRVDKYIVPLLDYILSIVCGIINLQNPIM